MRLTAHNLSSGYGDIVILRDVSLKVDDSEIVGVLGRNGMGKSTLVKTLAGMIPPAGGVIALDDVDVTRKKASDRARMGMTTVVQGRGIFRRLTVREHLEMGRIASSTKTSHLDEVLEYFPRLKERLRQLAGTLSGGEQQMLAIGTGLMTSPSVMLLDEPSDGIMPTLVHEIMERIRRIRDSSGLSVLIVEQNIPVVLGMADRCVIIENGRVVAEGATEEMAQSDLIQKYLAL